MISIRLILFLDFKPISCATTDTHIYQLKVYNNVEKHSQEEVKVEQSTETEISFYVDTISQMKAEIEKDERKRGKKRQMKAEFKQLKRKKMMTKMPFQRFI